MVAASASKFRVIVLHPTMRAAALLKVSFAAVRNRVA